MNELKKHLSLSKQVELMQERGLIIRDTNAVEKTLFSVNYYRLSGYLHNFKKPGSDHYRENLSWDALKHMYDFDRKLTRVLMFALEDIEETLKTRISYIITSHHTDDPIIYLKPMLYRDYASYVRFLHHFYGEVENNKKLPFVKHHIEKYGGFLPMWVAVELLTMGNLHALYDNLIGRYQKEIALTYNTGPRQLASWIENLTYTRNHLAHYMRIYNFNFGRSPLKCSKHRAYTQTTNMIFDQVFVMASMYSDPIEWNSYIIPEMKRIIDEYSKNISLSGIGFPADWQDILMK